MSSEAYVYLTPIFSSVTQNIYFCLELKGFSSLICGYFLLTWLSSSPVQKFNFHSWTLSCPLWHWFTVGAAPYFVGVSLSVKRKVHNTSIPGYLTPKISFLAVGGRWLSTNPERHPALGTQVSGPVSDCWWAAVLCLPPWKCQSQFWCAGLQGNFLTSYYWPIETVPTYPRLLQEHPDPNTTSKQGVGIKGNERWVRADLMSFGDCRSWERIV